MLASAEEEETLVDTLASSQGIGTASNYSSWLLNGFSSSTPQGAGGASGSTSTTVDLDPAQIIFATMGTASLSGYVYWDTNENGHVDSADWGIASAKVELTREDTGEFVSYVLTNQDGLYNFDGLVAGVYSIAMTTPCSRPGLDTSGYWSINDQPVKPVVSENMYSGITLDDGDVGTYFNFAELVYPSELITKDMLLDSSDKPVHTPDITVVPEPGSLVLLAIAAMLLGGFSWNRRRRDNASESTRF